jgi:hypothetical protein
MSKRRTHTTTRIEDASAPRQAEAPIEPPAAKIPPTEDGGRYLPKVPLKVYITAGGRKYDQLAGFEFYAKSQGLDHLSMVEWETAFLAFMKRPVG